MGHCKLPLQLGVHWTEIPQHRRKGNGKFPHASPGGQGASGMGCVRATPPASQAQRQAAGWLGADGGHLPWGDMWGSASSRVTCMTSSEAMDTLGQYKITVWEEENFQGKRCEFLMECPSIMERGFRKIRSIKVESGP